MNQGSETTQTPLSPQPETVDKRPGQVSATTPTQEEQASPKTSSRKRQTDDSDVEPQPKRARLTRKKLTRKNLAAFNKMGKKKASDPTDDSESTKTKTTSTTTSGFAAKARKNGILPQLHSKPPKDLKDLQKQYAQSRATASPPESEYERYTKKVIKAGNEATVVAEASELLKKYPDGYDRAYNRAFTNLPQDVGFNNGLSAPQPDFVEGLEAGEYRPCPIDDRIPGAALFQDDPYSITLPRFAGEWKGPSGDIKEATMQAAYDGAAMVYARAQALAYMGEEDPLGHAAATTFTIDGTYLNLYAHYAAPAEDDEDALEYHQFPILSTYLTTSYEDFKKGRKQLRNAQDHAKAQSEQLRDQLKQHWKQNRTKLPPVAEGVHPPDVEPPPHATDGYEDASPHVLQEEAEDEDD
ncbi:hypothetical protein B0T19DRAFT_52098 [Cercophora scortea]|uniref:DUF7924 domain-containing protein n=1 Tax=Cercophora scortea TaxID=314031 RepID=A0AAE0MLB7_9PEZI|nr:hypothetical protein B0T19DRAFT_52098 [Cercophora scortea]